MNPLSASEARKLLEAAQGNKLEALYVVAIHTGMRRGKLLGLKWKDVDLGSSTIRVRRTLTRAGTGYALGEPKTKKSRRTLRLTQKAANALRSHRASQAQEKLRAGSLYGMRISCLRAKAEASSTPPTSVSDPSPRS
jgi:integrase